MPVESSRGNPVMEVIDDLLDSNDIMRMFQVTKLCVSLWRKHYSLPFVIIKGSKSDAVRFRYSAVRAWSLRTSRPMYARNYRRPLKQRVSDIDE